MDARPIEYQIGELLAAKDLHLATAESCTGGLIAHRITNVAGSSLYFLGGVVAYDNAVKTNLLHVPTNVLEQFGAVSQEVVLAMASGVRSLLGAEIGLAISGIAGPGGGTADKPVGLTWIGLNAGGFQSAWNNVWSGDRLQVKEQSAQQALHLLAEYLRNL